ncbi:MAG: hypothetical protein ACREQV_22490, partial [Candidatus Binatia bacterium]
AGSGSHASKLAGNMAVDNVGVATARTRGPVADSSVRLAVATACAALVRTASAKKSSQRSQSPRSRTSRRPYLRLVDNVDQRAGSVPAVRFHRFARQHSMSRVRIGGMAQGKRTPCIEVGRKRGGRRRWVAPTRDVSY